MTEKSGDGGNRQILIILAVAAVVLLALGVGLLAGIYLGRDQRPSVGADYSGHSHIATHAGQPCAFDLAPENQYVLDGMTCNCGMPECHRTPLLNCHCDTAHAMKALAKDLVRQKMGPAEIGAELERRWGAGILPENLQTQGG